MLLKTLYRKLLCLIGDHKWTNSAEEGNPPTDEQLVNTYSGYTDYAKLYCKHCKTVSRLSCS